MSTPIGTLSYGAGAIAFGLLSLVLLTHWRGRLQGALFLAASLFSLVWALAYAWHGAGYALPLAAVAVLELTRNLLWLSFLLGLLAASEAGGLARKLRSVVYAITGVALASAVFGGMLRAEAGLFVSMPLGFVLSGLLFAVIGLMLIEQLYRNARDEKLWAIKYLCFGLGGLFVYDFYLHANALLFHQLDPDLWNARGAINALAVPLIAVAAARNPHWSFDVFVSRRLVFYSTTLAAAGAYLLTMAAGGYYIRIYGGEWGAVLQIVFLFGAILVLLITLFSGQARAQLRVFLSKHFYNYKYDYREEWLRLIGLLFPPGSEASLPDRALRAIAEIVESPVAGLWLENDAGEFVPTAGDLAGPDSPVELGDGALISFMRRQLWLIDMDEYRERPERYHGLELPDWLLEHPRMWLIVPLLHQRRPLGFVVLGRPRVALELTWEDYDLLKTVGLQVAGVLAQYRAAQRLAETRQFETYNRLAAFIMHDLNNLIAQQSLVVKNAARHKGNPEFIDDAIRTVDNSVQRMNRLLEQLRRGGSAQQARRCALHAVCEDVIANCLQRRPTPELELPDENLYALVPPEQLALVLGHVVRNAQDASPADGRVCMSLRREQDHAVIDIVDEGEGMDEVFIRERLFRPFDSTKGSKGMGIGAYQTRELIRAAGGEVLVESVPGCGTTFSIRLPLVEEGAQVRHSQASTPRTGAIS